MKRSLSPNDSWPSPNAKLTMARHTPSPTAVLRFRHVNAYSENPPPVAFPTTVTTFSYDDNRTLLLRSSQRHNEAVRWFRPPPIPADLEYNYHKCIWKPEVAESLDSLLASLLDLPMSTQEADILLNKISLITWRGIMTKILTAIYERREGWEVDAMIIDGTLYIQEHRSSESLDQKQNHTNENHRKFMYHGYAFESFSTSSQPPPHRSDLVSIDDVDPSTGWGGDVNTNVQWCNVCKTSIGQYRSILGGEVDCLSQKNSKTASNSTSLDELVQNSDSIELKTNLVLNTDQDYIRFEKFKLLKFYVQSFLLGIKRVIVGFRTRDGRLVTTSTFNTLEIPRLVRGKPHGWDPNACLTSGHEIISFIHSTISQSAETVNHQSQFDSAIENDEDFPVEQMKKNDLKKGDVEQQQSKSSPSSPSSSTTDYLSSWPVYRITFEPVEKKSTTTSRNNDNNLYPATSLPQPQISINFTQDYNNGGSDRVGFLSTKWVQGIWDRRKRLSKIQS